MRIKKTVLLAGSLLLMVILALTISLLNRNTGELEKKYSIEYSPDTKSPAVDTAANAGLLVAGRFTGPDGPSGSSEPALLHIDVDNDFALKNIDLARFNFGFEGIHEARPMILRNEYKIALGTHYLSDKIEVTEFIILNNGNSGFDTMDNLEIEFEERIDDARVRAVFVEDIDGDGQEEIVIGTRPKGILKYYKYIDKKWVGFNIDVLNETIHDIVVADTNGNGKKEILVTVSPISRTGDIPPVQGTFNSTGRIIRYELDSAKNTWGKETVWAYNRTFTDSPIDKRGFFEHPRYIFALDRDGNGIQEIVGNVLGSQNIELFKWNGSGYSREIIEDKLAMHDSAITVGDIDNDGNDEILALTLQEYTLIRYDYNGVAWERQVLMENLIADKNEKVSYLSIARPAQNSYGAIVYGIEPNNDSPNNAHADDSKASSTSFYYLEYAENAWNKKYIGTVNRALFIWGIFPLFSLKVR